MTRVNHTTIAWTRDSFHTFTTSRGRTSPTTAAMTIPASTAFGSCDSTPANGRKTNTAAPVTIPDQRETAPHRWFRLLRENEPSTGIPPKTPDTTLAAPWARNSRSGSHRTRSWLAKPRAMAVDSAKPTRAMTIPGKTSWGRCRQGNVRDGKGRVPGTSPTTGPA